MKSYVGLILISLQCVAVGEEDPHKEWLKLRATWLAKRSEITASEDGARLVALAAKRLRNSAPLSGLGVGSSAAHLQDEAKRYLPSIRAEFKLIERALQRPVLAFAIGDEPGAPDAYVLSSVGNGLAFRALAWATEGNVAGAAATLGDLAELGRRVPLHSKSPARGAVASKIADVARRMASADMRECGSYSATKLRALLEPVLQRVPRMPTEAQVIDGDVIQAVSAVDGWLRGVDVSGVWGASYVARDVGKLAGQPRERVVAAVVRYARAVRAKKDGSVSKGVAVLRAALIFQERSRSLAVVDVSLARLGLAALAHHEQKGTWPASLVALKPLFPGGELPGGTAGAALHHDDVENRLTISVGGTGKRTRRSWRVSDEVVEK